MNSTNPLKPQGSQFEQAASAARNRFQLAVYVSLAVCAVSLTVLLAVGCKKEEPFSPPPPSPATDQGLPLAPAPVDTNPVTTVGGPLPGPDLGATGAPPVTGATGPGVGAATPPVGHVAPETLLAPPPSTPAGMKEYVVQQGESFYTIGKKLGVNWKAIEKANPTVTPTKLKKGDKIMVPEPAAPTAATPGATDATPATGTITHKVAAGENLTKIGKKYGVTPREIQKANNLTTTRIKVGDKLTIPAKAAPAGATPPPPVPAPVPSPEPTPGPSGLPPAPGTPGIPGTRPA